MDELIHVNSRSTASESKLHQVRMAVVFYWLSAANVLFIIALGCMLACPIDWAYACRTVEDLWQNTIVSNQMVLARASGSLPLSTAHFSLDANSFASQAGLDMLAVFRVDKEAAMGDMSTWIDQYTDPDLWLNISPTRDIIFRTAML